MGKRLHWSAELHVTVIIVGHCYSFVKLSYGVVLSALAFQSENWLEAKSLSSCCFLK